MKYGVILVALLVLNSCGSSSDSGSKSASDIEAELLDAVFGTTGDAYKSWGSWKDTHTDLSVVKESLAPHGIAVRTFVNTVGKDAEASFTGALPDGTIIVKENFNVAATEVTGSTPIKNLTVMYKSAGFSASQNDWYWLAAKSREVVAESGQVDFCTDCHAGVTGHKDYVLSFGFGDPAPIPSLSDICPGDGTDPNESILCDN